MLLCKTVLLIPQVGSKSRNYCIQDCFRAGTTDTVIVLRVSQEEEEEEFYKLRPAGHKSRPDNLDPLKLRNDDTWEKEIKNRRLAMVAFVGFASQSAIQGKGPIASLKYHIANPLHRNIFTSKAGNEFAVALVAISLGPLLIEATKNTKGHGKVNV